jgi:hypothetical protein
MLPGSEGAGEPARSLLRDMDAWLWAGTSASLSTDDASGVVGTLCGDAVGEAWDECSETS